MAYLDRWRELTRLAVEGMASECSKRVYAARLDHFAGWYFSERSARRSRCRSRFRFKIRLASSSGRLDQVLGQRPHRTVLVRFRPTRHVTIEQEIASQSLWSALRRSSLRNFALFETFVVTAIAFAGLARADIDFSMAMTGVKGVVADGVYVGTYYGTADGGKIDIYCDDYFHESYIGQKWQAYRSTLSDLSFTRFGKVSDADTKYREVMWLVEQFGDHPTNAWGDIHAAMWDIFSPSAFAVTPDIDHWLTLAALPQNEGSVDPNAFYIYTPSNPSVADSQEFISPVSPQPRSLSAASTRPLLLGTVPEPQSIWLLGTILVIVLASIYRRVQGENRVRARRAIGRCSAF